MKQRIALLGSTGSIGVQTLDIVRENSELFEITTLTAHRNWEALARQAEEFAPDSVVIADDSKYDALRRALADRPVKVYAGADAIRQVVQADTVDTVVNALVGYAGLLPTVAAIEAGKKVALFGSYGWGGGEWMRTWESDCAAAGITLCAESVICQDEPDDAALAACAALGEALK